MRELANKQQAKEADINKKHQLEMAKLFTPAALQKLMADGSGLITNYTGIPMKISDPTASDVQPFIEPALKYLDPTLTFEASKVILKRYFQKQKTYEALVAYDEKIRQEKKSANTPSYLGVSTKKNLPAPEPTQLDLAAKKVREIRQAMNARFSLTRGIRSRFGLL